MIQNTDLQFLGRSGVNYLLSPGSETGRQGWSLFTTVWASGVPTTISAGAANCTLASSTTAPLRGSRSLQFAITTASPALVGQGFISDVFTIDNADLAKVLTAAFDYNFSAGGSTVDVSGTSTQTLEIWVYNVGLAAWIQPAGFRGMNQNSLPGYVATTFQTDSSNASNKNQYRLAVIIKNTPAATFTMQIDQAMVGPQPSQVTDSTDTRVVAAKYSGGSSAYGANAVLQYNTKVYDSCNSVTTGAAWKFTANVSGYYRVEISAIRTNTTTFSAILYVDGVSNQNILTALNNFTYQSGGTTVYLNAGQYIDLRTDNASTIEIGYVSIERVMGLPAVDTSSVVAARYHLNGPQLIGPGTSILNYETKIFDTHGAVTTGASWKFTAPISGIYRVSTIINIKESTFGSASQMNADVFKGGVYVTSICPIRRFQPGTTNNADNGTILIQLKAGEYIDVRQYQNTAGNLTIDNGGSQTAIDIERLAGPSVIAATETVAANYKTSSSQSVTTATNTTIIYDSKVYDTHGFYNPATGVGTIPISGKYRFSAALFLASQSLAPTATIELFLYIGVTKTRFFHRYNPGVAVTVLPFLNGSFTYDLLAGQTFEIRTYTTGPNTSLQSDSSLNYFTIERIGN